MMCPTIISYTNLISNNLLFRSGKSEESERKKKSSRSIDSSDADDSERRERRREGKSSVSLIYCYGREWICVCVCDLYVQPWP